MTNRPDLIDDALKRPGRLEVHKEIGKIRQTKKSKKNRKFRITKPEWAETDFGYSHRKNEK